MQEQHPLDAQRFEQEQQARTAQQQELRRQQQEADLKALMSAAIGRRFVWRMLERAGVYRSSFSTEPSAMAFNEGRRSLGLALLGEVVGICPKEYDLMAKEARE